MKKKVLLTRRDSGNFIKTVPALLKETGCCSQADINNVIK
jgi:hypothetical protein